MFWAGPYHRFEPDETLLTRIKTTNPRHALPTASSPDKEERLCGMASTEKSKRCFICMPPEVGAQNSGMQLRRYSRLAYPRFARNDHDLTFAGHRALPALRAAPESPAPDQRTEPGPRSAPPSGHLSLAKNLIHRDRLDKALQIPGTQIAIIEPPRSSRLVSADTMTVFGLASSCRRAARLAASPTTASLS